LRAFIDLPARIYSGLDGFEPPLALDRQMMLDPKSSALWKKAKVCYWLAWAGDEPVGRVSAQIESPVPIGLAPSSGGFGCLDAIDDRAVIDGLIETAARWLAEHGCTNMYGPCSLSMNEEPGLLVAGQDQPPMTMTPWHPPYLEAHLADLGFVKLCDLHNWRLDLHETELRQSGVARRFADRIPGLVLRSPQRSTYARDIQILCDVYNDGWQSHWGFVPLTPADLEGLDQLMKWLVPREAFQIVEVRGEPVAVMLVVPNLFELTKALGSRPSPVGWLKLVWRALTHRFESGRIIVFGLVKRMQDTVIGSTVAAMLVDSLIEQQRSLNGRWVEAGWVLENNVRLNRILTTYSFKVNKTFRIYGREI
jgi:hypothetical protein